MNVIQPGRAGRYIRNVTHNPNRVWWQLSPQTTAYWTQPPQTTYSHRQRTNYSYPLLTSTTNNWCAPMLFAKHRFCRNNKLMSPSNFRSMQAGFSFDLELVKELVRNKWLRGALTTLGISGAVTYWYCQQNLDLDLCGRFLTAVGIKRRMNNLPNAAIHLVQRKAPLNKIDSMFEDPTTSPVVAIVGDSATGKTELAKQYAAKHASKYYDVLYIQANKWRESVLEIAEDWDILSPQEAQQYKLNTGNFADITNVLKQVLRAASRVKGKRCLLILDNTNPSDMGLFLKSKLPVNTDVLITSTYRSLAVEKKLDLSQDDQFQLTIEQGIEILSNWIGTEKFDLTTAKTIATKFRKFPVVIAQLGKFMSMSGDSMKGDWKLFLQNKKDFLSGTKLDHPYQNDEYIDVTVSIQMIIDLLKDKDPEAYELLCVCAYLPSSIISMDVLHKIYGKTPKLQTHLTTLQSLIYPDQQKHCVVMHNLFQSIVSEITEDDAGKIFHKISPAIKDFEREFISANPKKGARIFKSLAASEQKASYPDPKRLSRYLHLAGAALRESGSIKESLKYLSQAHNLNLKELSDNLPIMAESYSYMARATYEVGNEDEAERHLNRAEKILKECPRTPNHLIAESYNSLGRFYAHKGLYNTARPYFENAQSFCTQQLAAAKYTFNLGYVELMSEDGDLDKALKHFKNAELLLRSTVGDVHLGLFYIYLKMGETLRKQHKQDEAWTFLLEALDLGEKCMVPTSYELGITRLNTARCELNLKKYTQAAEHFSAAILMDQSEFPNTPYIKKSFSNRRALEGIIECLEECPKEDRKEIIAIAKKVLPIAINQCREGDPLITRLRDLLIGPSKK